MTTVHDRQDDGASASPIAGVLGSVVAPFTWEEAARYLRMMADVASSLADRVNALVRRHPTATGGVLLGATIAGVAAWRRGRNAKPAARSPRAAAAPASAATPSRTAKRRSTTAAPRARSKAAKAAKAATSGTAAR